MTGGSCVRQKVMSIQRLIELSTAALFLMAKTGVKSPMYNR